MTILPSEHFEQPGYEPQFEIAKYYPPKSNVPTEVRFIVTFPEETDIPPLTLRFKDARYLTIFIELLTAYKEEVFHEKDTSRSMP